MLELIGYDAATASWFAPWRADDATAGRVLRVDAGAATVITAAGTQRVTFDGALLAELAERPDRTPCAGDWAVVRSWPDHRLTLAQVLPRRTVLARAMGAPRTEAEAPLAANLDLAVVVAGPSTLRRPDRLRELTEIAASSGATPFLVLTRAAAAGDAPAAVPSPAPVTATGLKVLRSPIMQLREPLAARRTVALLGDEAAALATLTRRLTGAHPIAARAGGLAGSASGVAVLCTVPGGGAVLSVSLPVGDHRGLGQPGPLNSLPVP